jgi:hypothetical protein
MVTPGVASIGAAAAVPRGVRTGRGRGLAVRIGRLERELATLRSREALATTIATVIGPGIAFSAAELFEHRRVAPELAAAFEVGGIRDARTLGMVLRQLCGNGLTRVTVDKHGAVWMIE